MKEHSIYNKGDLKMLVIKEYECNIEEGTISSDVYESENFNSTLFWAYQNSKKAGNELLDFNGNIWNKDVEAIGSLLRKFEIQQFTISVNMASLIQLLADFERNGVKMQGITQVKTSYGKEVPAILMKVD